MKPKLRRYKMSSVIGVCSCSGTTAPYVIRKVMDLGTILVKYCWTTRGTSISSKDNSILENNTDNCSTRLTSDWRFVTSKDLPKKETQRGKVSNSCPTICMCISGSHYCRYRQCDMLKSSVSGDVLRFENVVTKNVIEGK